MDEIPVHPRIPYGQADLRRIRLRKWLYVDKTRFLRRLEREDYVFLIRPRRFGKSLWISLLENYYDRFWADDFDATFGGTDVAAAHRPAELSVAAALLRAAEHPRGGGRHAAAGDSQPDGEATDVRLPARRLQDVEVFTVDLYRFEQLMVRMANEGEWQPAFEFLGEAIARQTGIRDYIAGEKVVPGFLAAYLSVTDYYVFRSEAELGKGHADISLEPLLARFPHLRHGYLIALKYLKRSERVQRGEPADGAGVAAAVSEATAQLTRYLADERPLRQFPGVRFMGLAVVFHGWELAHCEAVA